jgi:hypothetical protein
MLSMNARTITGTSLKSFILSFSYIVTRLNKNKNFTDNYSAFLVNVQVPVIGVHNIHSFFICITSVADPVLDPVLFLPLDSDPEYVFADLGSSLYF